MVYPFYHFIKFPCKQLIVLLIKKKYMYISFLCYSLPTQLSFLSFWRKIKRYTQLPFNKWIIESIKYHTTIFRSMLQLTCLVQNQTKYLNFLNEEGNQLLIDDNILHMRQHTTSYIKGIYTLSASLLYISWAPKYILSTNKFTSQYIASLLVTLFGKGCLFDQFQLGGSCYFSQLLQVV